MVADGDEGALGFVEADEAVQVDFSDVGRLVETARRLRVDGLAAICSDRAVLAAASAAEQLGLPGIGTDVALRMTNKAAMRAWLAEHGVPQPPFAVVRTFEEAVAAITRIGMPAVIKPVDSGGQRGVFRIDLRRDLARLLAGALAFSTSGTAIVERYVDGSELNVIAVARGGRVELLTISDRLRPPGVGFGVGWIHCYPSKLAATALEEAADVAIRAVRALGLRDGIAFPQLLVNDEGIHVVEVAARVPAGQMADLVYHAIGVDLIDIALCQALGRAVADDAVSPGETRPVAVRFFTAAPGILPTGQVRSVSGLDAVRAAPGVLAADLYIQLGETIRPVQVDADRRGYVVATGADGGAALSAATAAMTRLEVRTHVV